MNLHVRTPTEAAIIERRRKFHAAIAAKAVPDRGLGSKPAQQIAPESFPAEPDPPAPVVGPPVVTRSQFWFHIDEQRGQLSIATIQEAVCDHFGISRQELVSARRDHGVVRPRQLAIYFAKTLTAKSLPEIGRKFGGRDHTTVLSSVKRVPKVVYANAEFAHDFAILEERLARIQR